MENKRSFFIRDLIVRVLLIVLFIFLLMFLFPMPNLTPFYDSIFNDNVQTMKDAAEKWYTTERMPEKEGEVKKLTLQDMLDKKLILPFVDKDGNACDAKKSYVTVRKSKDEYIMKVSLTCGKQTDYIIEHIGCYNFCKDGKCSVEVAPVTETKTDGEIVVKPTNTPAPTPKATALEYEYQRVHNTEKWTLLDWQENKMTETKDLVKVDEKTEYTGQKKVTENSTIYKHVKENVTNHWTKDENWLDEEKDTSDSNKIRLYAVRTLYTGNKTTTETITKYQHVKKTNEDVWTDLDWTNTYTVPTKTTVLTNTRYILQKITKTTTTGYKCSAWKNDSTWRTSKPNDTETIEWGDAYDSKTETVTTSSTTKYTCGSWVKDSTWRTSKPANSNGVEWGSSYDSKTTSSQASSYDKIVTTIVPMTNDSNYNYKLFKKENKACTSNCNGKSIITYYSYYRYPKVSTTSYKYYKRTCSNVSVPTTKQVKYYKYKYKECEKAGTSSVSKDEKTVYSTSERDNLINSGYTLVRTEYKYKTNNPVYTADSIWTDSVISPAGYEYNNRTATVTKNVKTSLLNEKGGTLWVPTKADLGEYTEDITTRKQYKYYYNNPTIDTDEVWTDSIESPEGYHYANESKTTEGKTTYVDLGSWVDSKSKLGEYTYNVQTKTYYRYKKRTYSSYTETKWFTSNPGGDWKATGRSRKVTK